MSDQQSWHIEQRHLLPSDPGIYKLLDSDGTILYIGKAKNLKKRVSSYFGSNKQHAIKTIALMSHVTTIEIIICKTENDAFVLENQLIKHFQPKYNIQLKDDKNYPYIKISKEHYPRLSTTRYKDSKVVFILAHFPILGPCEKH